MRIPALLPDRFIDQYGISPRECEIISMIVRGYSNRKIGETLFISAMTVKNHIYHIYRKTGVWEQGSAPQFDKLTKMRLLDYCEKNRGV